MLSYRSGLFCVSRTAARGMPKFDAGPQKSVWMWDCVSFHDECQLVRRGGVITYESSRSNLSPGSP